MKLILEIEGPQEVLEEVDCVQDMMDFIFFRWEGNNKLAYGCKAKLKHVFDAQEGANVGQGQSSNGS